MRLATPGLPGKMWPSHVGHPLDSAAFGHLRKVAPKFGGVHHELQEVDQTESAGQFESHPKSIADATSHPGFGANKFGAHETYSQTPKEVAIVGRL